MYIFLFYKVRYIVVSMFIMLQLQFTPGTTLLGGPYNNSFLKNIILKHLSLFFFTLNNASHILDYINSMMVLETTILHFHL